MSSPWPGFDLVPELRPGPEETVPTNVVFMGWGAFANWRHLGGGLTANKGFGVGRASHSTVGLVRDPAGGHEPLRSTGGYIHAADDATRRLGR